jgi:hypothetical protein
LVRGICFFALVYYARKSRWGDCRLARLGEGMERMEIVEIGIDNGREAGERAWAILGEDL